MTDLTSTNSPTEPHREPLDLAPIRARVEAATPGPWVADPDEAGIVLSSRNGGWDGRTVAVLQVDDDGLLYNPADAEFVAHARQDVPALLAEVERLRAVTTVERLAATTNLTADEAATAIAQLMNVMQTAPDERWWESLVQAECEVGHVIFIDDGDGTVYACPACALAEARAALAARPAPVVSVADIAAIIDPEAVTLPDVSPVPNWWLFDMRDRRRAATDKAVSIIGALGLAVAAPLGRPGCETCGGTGVAEEEHDGGWHPVHCPCTDDRPGRTVADAPAAEPVPLGHEACPEAIEIDGSASRCGKPRGHEGAHDDHKGATWTIRPAADPDWSVRHHDRNCGPGHRLVRRTVTDWTPAEEGEHG